MFPTGKRKQFSVEIPGKVWRIVIVNNDDNDDDNDDIVFILDFVFFFVFVFKWQPKSVKSVEKVPTIFEYVMFQCAINKRGD